MKWVIFLFAVLLLAILVIAPLLLETRRWWCCAWCRRWFNDLHEITRRRPWHVSNAQASHGICPECFRRFRREELDRVSAERP